MHSDVLRQYEAEGKAVRVDNGGKALVELKLIPKN
jgi:hypothetical protein